MKKIIFLGVALLVAIVLITPWATGLIVEKKLKNQLLQMQSPHLSVDIVNYQRHWFSSDVDIKISYTPTILSSYKLVEFDQAKRFTVLHGPIILSKNKQGQRRLDLAEALITWQNKTPSENSTDHSDFNFESLLHYTGRSDSFFEGKIEYILPDGHAYLKIPQINGRLALSSSMKHEVGAISIPQIQISDGKNTTLQLNNFSLDTSGERFSSFLWLTNNKIHLDSVQIHDGTNVIDIKNINLDLTYHIDNNVLVIQGKLNAEAINYNNQTYGPQVLEFHEKFNMEIVNGIRELSTENVDIMKQKLLTLLMTKGMEFGIDKLQILTPNGNMNGTFNFKLNPMDEKLVAASNPMSVFTNFKNFEAQLNLNVSKTLLETIASWFIIDPHHDPITASHLLDEFVKRNLLSIKDNNYALTFTLNKGEIQLNDKQYTDSMEIVLLIIQAMNVKSVPAATPVTN